jgi:DNA-binding beta-propeller fold protein YncE
MVTNAADTRLYVANIQSADLSVVDIEPGSATENQVLATVAARATDDIAGGRAEGWEPFVIGGRAPRGIAFSDAHDVIFLTSIGPQTGPRQGVVLVGGAIINPTITVIDAATNTTRAHVALELFDPDRSSCTDPELTALDDVRGLLYVTCQGSGTVDVLDTLALANGLPAELAIVSLPLPTDVAVPTLALPSTTGAFGAKVCGAFTSTPGASCTTDAQCGGCPSLVEGLPVVCCMENNPIGLHNGPRGIALSEDRSSLYVVNQFTTSISTLDVSAPSPSAIAVTRTTSFPGAFGSDTPQRDRRLGQIEFFTDVKKTGVSCATCHIDDHQDGVFFEADVRGPRLRRVLSVRATRDFPPLLQDQLVPDLLSFTDIVVQAERGGPIPCIPCIEIGGNPFCFGGGTCTITSDSENRQNALYAKAITFFPNPNLNPDGSFSTAVPLPGGVTGDAVRGAQVFDRPAARLRQLDPGSAGPHARRGHAGAHPAPREVPGRPAPDRLRRQQRLHRAHAAWHLGHVPAAAEWIRRARRSRLRACVRPGLHARVGGLLLPAREPAQSGRDRRSTAAPRGDHQGRAPRRADCAARGAARRARAGARSLAERSRGADGVSAIALTGFAACPRRRRALGGRCA